MPTGCAFPCHQLAGSTSDDASHLAQRFSGGNVGLCEAVGIFLKPNTCLALCGPLGSGKTQFAKGVAKGLGSPPASRLSARPLSWCASTQVGCRSIILIRIDLVMPKNWPRWALTRCSRQMASWWSNGGPTREVLPNDAWWFEFSHVSPDVRQISLRIEAISPDLIRQAGDILRPIDKPESPPETTL
jgi:energy-coupling factor transporter ATP-binding protein EcfA2